MDVTKILDSSPLQTVNESITKIVDASPLDTGLRRMAATKILFAAVIGPPICVTYNFILKVVDADGCEALKPCQIEVCPST